MRVQLNLLDTPGHSDFSEDTYRTLAAADNAVMLVDSAKGIEPQTRKLFEVARMRGLPIFTFCNKMDRPSMSGFDIIDQLEKEFGLAAYPLTWPIGSGAHGASLGRGASDAPAAAAAGSQSQRHVSSSHPTPMRFSAAPRAVCATCRPASVCASRQPSAAEKAGGTNPRVRRPALLSAAHLTPQATASWACTTAPATRCTCTRREPRARPQVRVGAQAGAARVL